MTQTPDLDYPVANPPDIAPIIFRAMILQAMAMQYFNYMRDAPEDFSLDEAFDAARATWETDWEIDPDPRTMEAAKEEVSNDLAYWNEE